MSLSDWIARLLKLICGGRQPMPEAATKLAIEVRVFGDLASPSATYTLLSTEPKTVSGGRILNPDGDINLEAVLPELVRDPLTEITFQLVGTVKCDDAEHAVEFRRPAQLAFHIRRQGGGRPTPGQFRAFFPDPQDHTRLAVLDQNNDQGRYFYCLRIRAPGCPGQSGKLDPSIINR